MEKRELDEKITEASKSIFSYCMARTASRYDAEDLAQDIVVEIYRSAANIRDDKAFYGFLWAVAGNVYRQWCRKRRQEKAGGFAEELSEEELLPDSAAADAFEAVLGEDSDILRLRRELALLSEKYRRAAILYYLEDRSCAQIADILSVSEAMVKYLLFKARKIVKDGMGMERNYGEQSYNPREFGLHFWGDVDHYGDVCSGRLAQNILFACYNDRLSAEQISLEIGVGVPYIEDELKKLCRYGLLCMEGSKYYSSLVIFTREFQREAGQKTARLKENIAGKVKQAVLEKEAAIRGLGFAGSDMDGNTYRWQAACMLLYYAVICKFQGSISLDYPVDVFGSHAFHWGVEKSSADNQEVSGDGQGSQVDVQGIRQKESGVRWGFANATVEHGSGYIKFMDFPVNGGSVQQYFFGSRLHTNIYMDIAAGKTAHFSENDRETAAEMVRAGYVVQQDGKLAVNAPVLTGEQEEGLWKILDEPAEEIAAMCGELLGEISKVLQNHVPVHLKKQAKQMPYFALMGDSVSAPVRRLYGEGFLMPAEDGSMLPTTFVVLKN
ncbi:MAG: RNA polymerase sigma factor [Lachnospiraceae bacterium]|nr:RNA polymerase sigma factor [Lachnospiraceae bacterium]